MLPAYNGRKIENRKLSARQILFLAFSAMDTLLYVNIDTLTQRRKSGVCVCVCAWNEGKTTKNEMQENASNDTILRFVWCVRFLYIRLHNTILDLELNVLRGR